MVPLPWKERLWRGHHWPWMIIRFGFRIWQTKTVRLKNIPPLAEKHFHNWVWGYIDADDVYLPRKPETE